MAVILSEAGGAERDRRSRRTCNSPALGLSRALPAETGDLAQNVFTALGCSTPVWPALISAT